MEEEPLVSYSEFVKTNVLRSVDVDLKQVPRLRLGGWAESDNLKRRDGKILADQIESFIREGPGGSHYIIYGPSTSGKSTALLETVRRLENENEFAVLFMSASGSDPDSLESHLVSELYELDRPSVGNPDLPESLDNWITHIRNSDKRVAILLEEVTSSTFKNNLKFISAVSKVIRDTGGVLITAIDDRTLVDIQALDVHHDLKPRAGRGEYVEVQLLSDDAIRSMAKDNNGRPIFAEDVENWIIRESGGYPVIAATLIKKSIELASEHTLEGNLSVDNFLDTVSSRSQLSIDNFTGAAANQLLDILPIDTSIGNGNEDIGSLKKRIAHIRRSYPITSSFFKSTLEKVAIRKLRLQMYEIDVWRNETFDPYMRKLLDYEV